MASKLFINIALTRTFGTPLLPAVVGSIPAKTLQLTPGSDLVSAFEQSVGFAAEEALTVTDVTDEALVVLINNDDTNFVEAGTGSFTPFLKIPPGEIAILPRASVLANIRLKADTAACQVSVLLYKMA